MKSGFPASHPWLWLFILLLVGLAGCASTRITSSWKDPGDPGTPLRKLMVFVAVQDEAIRRFAENEAVRSLPAGTEGVASHTVFDRPEPDIGKLRERLVREGFDGALVARLVSVDRSQIYHPPQVHMSPFAPWHGYWPHYRSFYWYYPQAFTYVTPAYTSETTRVLVETVIYRLPSGNPVWSVVSESVNPDSTLELVNELIRITGARLREEGLLLASNEAARSDGRSAASAAR